MIFRFFILSVITAILAVNAEVTYIQYDQVEPFTQPKPTTVSDKAAVKYKPLLTVSSGCYPYAAVQANGAVSAGLGGFGHNTDQCTGTVLGSQVYARSTWYKGKWAIMYAWYLPRGRRDLYPARHYWETVVVWIDDPALENATVLAVSLNYGLLHGKRVTPVKPQYIENSRLKLNQHRGFSSPTPKLRLTEQKGKSYDLITWDQLPAVARDALSEAKFDTMIFKMFKRKMPLKDGVFEKRLKDAWPF